jgi:GNAT superfamily N-acetyltransferase
MASLPQGLLLEPLGEGEIEELQGLLESDPDYAERVTGGPPGPSDALSTLLERPEGTPEENKAVLGARAADDRLVGVIDLVRGYPARGTVFIGLLLVHRDERGHGVGSDILGAATRWVRETWPEAERWRLAVVDTNAEVAGPFWRQAGFEPTGESRPYRFAHVESVVRLHEAPIARGG